MSVKLWEELDELRGQVKDLLRRVAQLEKQAKEGPKRETLALPQRKAG